jgi:U3 small nucleolar RNA-associated protein 23
LDAPQVQKLITASVISQCSIRELYADRENQPAIEVAKSFERRRCNHHTLEKPLSALECLSSVVDEKDNGTNKHNYVVASQDQSVRAFMRQIPGVPLIYIHRSVMIMEPMADATQDVRSKDERMKFRAGLKSKPLKANLGKRPRDEPQPDLENKSGHPDAANEEDQKKRRKKGPKGPNPLSAMKPKKRNIGDDKPVETTNETETDAATAKKKRKRKPSRRPDDSVMAAGDD